MTRTTVRLNEDLLREAKKVAAESGKTLTALIEESLRKSLAQRSQPRKRKRIVLPTFGGQGTWPGVNIDSNAALLDYMDGLSDSD
jgi:hypothetical protein